MFQTTKTRAIILSLLLSITLQLIPVSVNAQCPSRQLTKVCNACKTQALNSSECMATNSCPTCPTCPTQTCNSRTTASQRLKSSYRLTTSVITGRNEIYDITIINIDRDSWRFNFTYDVTQPSRLLTTRSAKGYTNSDTVVFWLPLDNGGLKTIACAGEIDASGTIEGGCYGITTDGLLTREYGGSFTAIPLN